MSTTPNKQDHKTTPLVIAGKDQRPQTEKDKQQEDQKHTIKKDISRKSSQKFSGRK